MEGGVVDGSLSSTAGGGGGGDTVKNQTGWVAA